MIKRNPHFTQLSQNYLFPEIHRRKLEFQSKNPHACLISLGVGDTTQPIPPSIVQEMVKKAQALGTAEGYTGYGPPFGNEPLREKIASTYYKGLIDKEDVFVSDGAKCDIGRLQLLFGSEVSVAIQDPAYPVYLDGCKIHGNKKIFPLPCSPENDFFPDLEHAAGANLIYFCSPNNPTGAVATRHQLEQLVSFAKKTGAIILFDSAYACYISHPDHPKSIYEIEGAKEAAIEISSFSKIAGFTGVRLGWTIVPEQLKFSDGSSVKRDWMRLTSTLFNGACNISQQGGMAILCEQGQAEVQQLITFYMENARLIREAAEKKGWEVYGGGDAPYIWIRFKEENSWDVFQQLLEKAHLVTTPGAGFGPEGHHFIRMTAFGSRPQILEAIERIQKF